ncbi:MAG: Ig-like domain-containing protein [bacterium]|jgi:hypothetical protein|nr:Ig-like domain-containing protein [bacterium]
MLGKPLNYLLLGLFCCFCIASTGQAGIQYSNNFENPSSTDVQEAWPEWIKFDGATDMKAVNGRIEWYGGGNNVQWIRLDKQLPQEYTFEFDFFTQQGVNGRFSVWPIVKPGESIFERHNYFLRANTHYFNGADTVPSEGPRDFTLPVGSAPHRLRFEVSGDHVVFLYKDRGEGGWILVDERDFPAFGEDPRYIQLGFNHDGGDAGLHYVDNIVVSYIEENLFNYKNSFDNPSSTDVQESWPEWVKFAGATDMKAANGRIEWYAGGGNAQWIRLDKQLPLNFVMEFDFFSQSGINGRFSVWPLVKPGESIFERHNYFLRANTHYFNGADTVPSEGPRDMTLPAGSSPHRLRFEVTGDHVVFLFKDRGEGGWILVDDRDFPPFGDDPRYIQLGFNHDGGDGGLHYIDNIEVRGLSSERAEVSRDIQAEKFEGGVPFDVNLLITVTGTVPSISVTEDYPDGWTVTNISHGGTLVNGKIIWNFSNLSETTTLSYTATPPALNRTRMADFSGSVGSGDEEERITGDSSIALLLPYLYREAVDYDFSGSPVNGKNYPTETEFKGRYAEGMDGIPSTVVYSRPTGNGSLPAIDTVFNFPAGADFHQANPQFNLGAAYVLSGYRDDGEISLEKGASDSGTNVGGLSPGDWFRYTFDFGDTAKVLMVNALIQAWAQNPNVIIDLYVDNKFKGEYVAPETPGNAFTMFSVGPFEVGAGVHSLVLAVHYCEIDDTGHIAGIGRMEVVTVSGIGQVTRTLTADGFFEPANPLTVSLKAEAKYGTYKPYIEENVPSGSVVTAISDGGQQVGNKIIWDLDPIETTKTVTYTVQAPEGARFLLFSGFCDIGLPLADRIYGDTSVTNQVWLFGKTLTNVKTDAFAGSSLQAPWEEHYGTDPSLATDYTDGVVIEVADGTLLLEVDIMGVDGKFDEYANGRRAPMIVRTDIPTGDWRMEADVKMVDAYFQTNFAAGMVVAYNDNNDTDISGDEYLFGFYQGVIQVEHTNVGNRGNVYYHNYADEFEWFDAVENGDVHARFGVSKRGEQLIFSVKLPNRPWQLIGAPVTETRQATRVGFYMKIWGNENFCTVSFDNFQLAELDLFVGVDAWQLY